MSYKTIRIFPAGISWISKIDVDKERVTLTEIQRDDGVLGKATK